MIWKFETYKHESNNTAHFIWFTFVVIRIPKKKNLFPVSNQPAEELFYIKKKKTFGYVDTLSLLFFNI